MALIRSFWKSFRPRPQTRRPGYDAEVLFAGWVDLPPAFLDSRK
jgi:hypothetical protein